MSWAIVVGAGASLISSAISKNSAKNRAENAEEKAQQASAEAERLIAERSPVYDASDSIRDMKALIENPFENLGVATQAAQMQVEEADIALANTLDTIQATGMGAGGATALAQAAAKSKRGVSANIEQQEAANEKLKAQGKAAMNQQLIAIEGQAIAAEERAADKEAGREQAAIDRAYGEADFYLSSQMANEQAEDAAVAAGISSLGSMVQAGIASNYNPSPSNSTAPPVPNTQSSDRRLKKNIKLINKSKSGLKVYTFEYINKKGLYKGVMSDEVPLESVVIGSNGFDMVDYSKIDVEFEKIK